MEILIKIPTQSFEMTLLYHMIEKFLYLKMKSKRAKTFDDRQIVMANNESFGTFDFQSQDTIFNTENELLQQWLATPSDIQPTHFLLDAQMPIDNTQNNGRAIHNITPNDIPPDVQTFDGIPLPPIQDHELDSDVEDEPHFEPEPQFLQQRDNVATADPVPEPRYNLRNKN
jgi:hypothetical protein